MAWRANYNNNNNNATNKQNRILDILMCMGCCVDLRILIGMGGGVELRSIEFLCLWGGGRAEIH